MEAESLLKGFSAFLMAKKRLNYNYTMNRSITLAAGRLDISVTKAERPLDDLLAFASRVNEKRGFLFVSKILGKHWPVKPSQMRASYSELADFIGAGSSTYVVGLAETATGLGAGVADSLSRIQTSPVFYQHTTRCQMDRPLWLSLDEAHSHAVDHLFYQPQDELLEAIEKVGRLVLVDDEISTGRTLKLLAERLLPKLAAVKEVVIVALVSWLDEETRLSFDQFPVPVRFVTLLDGSFEFHPDSEYQATLPAEVDRELSTSVVRDDLGRLGLKMPYRGALPQCQQEDKPLTVVGDGEHLYLPFLLAEAEEQRGRDVVFQSTTRSPIALGTAIESKLSFPVDARAVRHYLYNVCSAERQLLFLLENEAAYATHGLLALLEQRVVESRHGA